MDKKNMKQQTAENMPSSPAALPGCIPFSFPRLPNVHCVFSTISSGNMAVNMAVDDSDRKKTMGNRKKLFKLCAINGWAELNQVHGDAFVEADVTDMQDSTPYANADGQCTMKSGLPLAIKTADCQPILLADIHGTAIAALLVGWKGNRINFPATGLNLFCEKYGLMPAEVMAVRGPSLGPGEAEFVNFGEEWGPDFLPWFNTGRMTMDLWTLTKHQLTEAGMLPQNVFSLDLCTKSLPGMLFSFRRGDAGRQISLIWKE